MKIQFTQEKRGEIERIQREFRDKLSPNEILRATAQGINSALTRSISRINKQVKEEYNIKQKYLSRQVKVSPKANSSTLWGGIKINTGVLPLIAFNPKQSGSSIYFSTHKGKPTYMRNSFITTVRGTGGGGPHKGVFSRGHYDKNFIPGRETTRTGKVRITQIMGRSVFKMSTYKSVAEDVQQFMGAEVSARVEGILRSRVDKIARANQ